MREGGAHGVSPSGGAPFIVDVGLDIHGGAYIERYHAGSLGSSARMPYGTFDAFPMDLCMYVASMDTLTLTSLTSCCTRPMVNCSWDPHIGYVLAMPSTMLTS